MMLPITAGRMNASVNGTGQKRASPGIRCFTEDLALAPKEETE